MGHPASITYFLVPSGWSRFGCEQMFFRGVGRAAIIRRTVSEYFLQVNDLYLPCFHYTVAHTNGWVCNQHVEDECCRHTPPYNHGENSCQ